MVIITTYLLVVAMVTGYQRVNGTPYFFRDSGVWVKIVDRHVVENMPRDICGKIPYVWGGADLNSGVDCSSLRWLFMLSLILVFLE